jgi:hypothetical protein
MRAFNRPFTAGRPSTEAISAPKETKIATASRIEVSFLRLEVERRAIADRMLLNAI